MTRKKKFEYLKTVDVAHILNCTPMDVLKWANIKILKGHKEGRFWRFKYLDVVKFREKRRRNKQKRRKKMATSKKNGENLLRSKDVAHLLDCSPDDVIELARRKILRATKQGRFWRFRRQDVKDYERKNR